MSVRSATFLIGIGWLLVACGTVDTGSDPQIAQIIYDQNFFYCEVEPMLFNEQCGPGQSGMDAPNGCHYNVTSFRLQPHDPVPCTGKVANSASISAEAQSNYQAAEREMSPDPDRAPLFLRPTAQAAHPRQVITPTSPEAELIRQWATENTSQ